MDLLPLINGFNNHVTVGLTYSSCAYSTNDEIHESSVSTWDWPQKRPCLEIPGLPQSVLLGGASTWHQSCPFAAYFNKIKYCSQVS